jgi:hypothetical protein
VADCCVAATRSSRFSDEGCKRYLAACHRLILEYAAKKRTADRGEFGDQTRTAAGDAPTSEPATQGKYTT